MSPTEGSGPDAVAASPAEQRGAPDPWHALRSLTPARIALGRAGASLPTRAHLDFQLAHARARDAVHDALDVAAFRSALSAVGLESVAVRSAAPDRATYLQRPDLGRRLDSAAGERLPPADPGDVDAALVVADGLSARAAQSHAAPLIAALAPRLRDAGWRLAPVVVVEQGRVAIGDEIGGRLGARLVLVLIGERPGLTAPDSLGAYLTWDPRPGRTDAERNCVSNIRPEGFVIALAAEKLVYLMLEAARRRLSGVALKDDGRMLGA
ncbi:MAG TPA: ethanolamine ammonia-lyase subunit EutC [Gemmatimonadales bacterium]|nr:ethanolamine ammonia-lyase subunit EutC [Gemmatimonadales bacterium]